MKPIINALDRLAEIGRRMRETETRPVAIKTADPVENFGEDTTESAEKPTSPNEPVG